MIRIPSGVWPWLQDLASIAPLATFAAAVVAVGALWQKSRNDRCQAWWERLRWATDTLQSRDPQSRQTGSAALKAVTLPSRGITVVAKDITQARILDNAESVIEANG